MLNRAITNKKGYGWLAVILALGILVIHTALLESFYNIEFLGYAWDEIRSMVVDCVIVAIMLLAWETHKKSFEKGLLFSTVALVAFYFSGYDPFFDMDDILLLLILTAPLLISLLKWAVSKIIEECKTNRVCGLIWFFILLATVIAGYLYEGYYHPFVWISCYLSMIILLAIESVLWFWFLDREYESREKRDIVLWRAWMVCILLFFAVTIYTGNDDILYLEWTCWGKALIAALPVLYAVVWRWLNSRNWSNSVKIVLYFALCLIPVYSGPYSVFYLVMPIVVCLAEPCKTRGELGSRCLVSAVFFSVCSLYYLDYKRLRQIIYYLGGPAIDIPDQERINWLGYRFAAVKSFFTGDTGAFQTVEGLPKEAYPGYQAIMHTEDLGALIYRFGWWWLLILVFLVVAIALILIRSDWGKVIKNRNMKYLAISYLIRAGASCVTIISLAWYSGYDFPFSVNRVMDLLFLVVMIKFESKERLFMP